MIDILMVVAGAFGTGLICMFVYWFIGIL